MPLLLEWTSLKIASESGEDIIKDAKNKAESQEADDPPRNERVEEAVVGIDVCSPAVEIIRRRPARPVGWLRRLFG